MDGQFTWRSRAHSVKVSLVTARSPHPEYSPRMYDVSPRPKLSHAGHDVNIVTTRVSCVRLPTSTVFSLNISNETTRILILISEMCGTLSFSDDFTSSLHRQMSELFFF